MDDEINLLDYLKIIIKRKKLIFAFVAIAFVLAVFQGIGKPKMYQAEVTLINMDNSLPSPLQAATNWFSSYRQQATFADLKTILGSRALARSIMEQYNLKSWLGEAVSPDDAAMRLRSLIDVKSDNLIKITARWKDASGAAFLANTYAQGLIAFLNQRAININLQILDEALVPKSAIGNNLRQEFAIYLAGGLLSGIFFAFFLEYFDKIKHELT